MHVSLMNKDHRAELDEVHGIKPCMNAWGSVACSLNYFEWSIRPEKHNRSFQLQPVLHLWVFYRDVTLPILLHHQSPKKAKLELFLETDTLISLWLFSWRQLACWAVIIMKLLVWYFVCIWIIHQRAGFKAHSEQDVIIIKQKLL